MSRGRRTVLTVLVILALCFIWGNSALSRASSDGVSDAVENALSTLGELPGDGGIKTTLIIRKSAHFVEYFVLGILVMLRVGQGRGKAFWAFLGCAAAACLDETIQILSGRAYMVKDCALDAFGAAVGIAAALVILTLADRKKVIK